MSVMDILCIILAFIASLGVLSVVIINIYARIRCKFPVSVNCWFCNAWLKVAYELQNSWDCPYCEQYNGFTADGDYNKPIPAQHDELMNNAVLLQKKQSTPVENGLCKVCNNNQRLKIHQLAVFSPIDEFNYDEEVERYQQQLERSYRLCLKCEKTVKRTLQKQTSMLLAKRLSHLKSQGLSLLNLSLNPMKFSTAKNLILSVNTLKLLTVFLAIIQIILTVRKLDFKKSQKSLPKDLLPYILLAKDFSIFIINCMSTVYEYFYYLYFTILNNSLFSYSQKYIQNLNLNNVNFLKFYLSEMVNMDKSILVPCMGVFIESLIIILGQIKRKNSYLRCIAWVINITISYWRISGSLPDSHYPELIQIILSLYLIKYKSSKKSHKRITQQNTATDKLIDSNKHESTIVNNDLSSKNYDSYSEKLEHPSTFKSPEVPPKLASSFNSTRSLSPISPIYNDNSFANYKPPSDCHIFGQKAIIENPLTTTHFKFKPVVRSPLSPCSSDDSFSTHRSIFHDQLNYSNNSNKSNETLNYSFRELQNKSQTENELGEELNKLHLGSYPNIRKCGLPSAFKINSNISRPKPVLSPPRLHNITQSSWVAGGYWKSPPQYNNYNLYTNLSRSSSQSSGFGSQTSSQNNIDIFNSFPPSRNNSLSEFDKNSLCSEPPYHYTVKNSSYQNRIYPTLNDQQIYIIPGSNNSPPHSVLNGVCNSNESLRPNSVNSVLSHTVSNNSFNLSQKGLDPITYNYDKNFSSFNLNSSVIYKPKKVDSLNGYIKGSLLQKWREQNDC